MNEIKRLLLDWPVGSYHTMRNKKQKTTKTAISVAQSGVTAIAPVNQINKF